MLSRLISKAAQSRLSRFLATPAYQYMTIRNTTTRLVELMSGIQGSGTVMVSRRRPSSGHRRCSPSLEVDRQYDDALKVTGGTR